MRSYAILFFLSLEILNGQNIITNPDFKEVMGYDFDPSKIEFAKGWYAAKNSSLALIMIKTMMY